MKPKLAIKLPSRGTYIVAVSGGVDSVALLHLLTHQDSSDLRLRVAHVNHGLRPTAARDERLVRDLSRAYELPYHSVELELGSASEAQARAARYDFLFELVDTYRASGIITAHHADDRTETSIINTLRGGGRHGLAAGMNRAKVVRPLMHLRKADLVAYANDHGLVWCEDETNLDTTITRNFVRHELVPTGVDLGEYHANLVDMQQKLNRKLDQKLDRLYYQFKAGGGVIMPRGWVVQEPWSRLASFFHYLLRKMEPGVEFGRSTIEELVRLSKTAPSGSQFKPSKSLMLQVGYDTVAVVGSTPIQPTLRPTEVLPNSSLDYGPFRFGHGTSSSDTGTAIELPIGRYFLRTARPGDRIQTMAGTKKLQDLFVDKKIDRSSRANWPILVSDDEVVLWLPQLATSRLITKVPGAQRLSAEEIV